MIKRLHSTLFYAKDIKATAAFYTQLGFPVDLGADTVKIKMGDYTLAFTNENTTLIQNESGLTPKGLGVYTYIEVEDVDAYAKFLKDKGVRASTAPRNWPWGKREFVVRDPDRYKLVFYSLIK